LILYKTLNVELGTTLEFRLILMHECILTSDSGQKNGGNSLHLTRGYPKFYLDTDIINLQTWEKVKRFI